MNTTKERALIARGAAGRMVVLASDTPEIRAYCDADGDDPYDWLGEDAVPQMAGLYVWEGACVMDSCKDEDGIKDTQTIFEGEALPATPDDVKILFRAARLKDREDGSR